MDIEYYAHDGDKLFVERIVEYYRRLLDQSLRTHATGTSTSANINTYTASTQPWPSPEDLHTLEIVCFSRTNYTYQHLHDSSIYPPLSSSNSGSDGGVAVSVNGSGFFGHTSSWMSRQRKQEKIASILSYRRHLDYLTAKHIEFKRGSGVSKEGMSFMDRVQSASTEGYIHHAVTHTDILSQRIPIPAYDTLTETRIEGPDTAVAVDCSMREEDDVVLSYASLDSDDDNDQPPFHDLQEKDDEIIPSNYRSSPPLPVPSRTSQAVLNRKNQASSLFIEQSHIDTSLLPYTPSANHTHTHTPAGHTETGQSVDGTEDDMYTDEVAVYSQIAYQVSSLCY